MGDAPGGGHILTIEDPDGFPVNFIYGQAPVSRQGRSPEKLLFNHEDDKPRKKKFQRFEAGPAEVHKVGAQQLLVSGHTSNTHILPAWPLRTCRPAF